MNKFERVMCGIETTLAGKIEYFTPVTYGVDALTLKCEKGWQKRLMQLGTGISRPIDTAIQLAATPIFAAYKTVSGIVNSFRFAYSGSDYAWAVTKLVFSPCTFALRTFSDLLAVAFFGLTNLLPVKTIADVNNSTRSLVRLNTLHHENGRLFRVNLDKYHVVNDLTKHLSHSISIKFIKRMNLVYSDPQSMSRLHAFHNIIPVSPDGNTNGYSNPRWFDFRIWLARTLFLKPAVLGAM